MLRLTRTHRYRVSNRLAVLAAFLLVAATVASVGGSLAETANSGPALVGAAQQDEASVNTVRAAKAGKGFKVSLYLFRRN